MIFTLTFFKYHIVDANNAIQDANFLDKFNTSVVEIAPDDLYFLLQSFSMIALAREKSDWKVIRFVALDLLNIGFINETTKDICYKTVKDLLYNITFKYPELISEVLHVLKISLQKVYKNFIKLFISYINQLYQL